MTCSFQSNECLSRSFLFSSGPAGRQAIARSVRTGFKTSERHNWIETSWQDRLYGYLGGIARNKGATLLCAGGMPDHVHLLVSASATISLADLVNALKSNNSAWIHENIEGTRSFHWQNGYGAFSVSRSGVDAVREYIKNQAVHHTRQSFQDEFRALLVKHEIPFDEKWLWE